MICIMLILDPRSTALVLIDLQNGIIGRRLRHDQAAMYWPPLPPSPGGSAPQARLLCLSTSPWRMITLTRSANLWINPHRSPQADYQRAGATWAAASQKRAISASPNGNGAPSTVRNWTSSFDAEASGRSC